MKESTRNFLKSIWGLSGIIIFIILINLVKALEPSIDEATIKHQWLYPIGELSQFIMIVLLFVAYQISAIKFFSLKDKKLNFLLILKCLFVSFTFSLLVDFIRNISGTISDFENMINYFREHGISFNLGVLVKQDLPRFMLIGGIFTAPILEEILCRAVIYSNMKRRYDSIVLAMIASSVVFSLFHIVVYGYDIFTLLNIFLAGMLLAYTYEKAETIWSPIILHSLMNTLIFLCMHLVFPYNLLLESILAAIGLIVIVFTLIKYLLLKVSR